MRFLAFMGVTTILLTAVPVMVASEALPDETLEQAFEHTDTNKDGYADRREYYIRLVDVFYLADLDRNGNLDAREYEWTALGTFKDADANEDGSVDIIEFMNIGAKLYAQADADADGQLSRKEVEDFFGES